MEYIELVILALHLKNMVDSVTLGNKDFFNIKFSGRVSPRDDSLWGGKTPYVSPIDMNRDDVVYEIIQTNKTLSDKGVVALGSNIIPPQSVVLVSKSFINSIGRVAINQLPCGISDSLYGVVIKDHSVLLPKYVAYILASLKQQMHYFMKTSELSKMCYFSIKNLKSLSISLLDLSEQKEIIEKAESNNFDRKQVILNELINFLKEKNIICPLPIIWNDMYKLMVREIHTRESNWVVDTIYENYGTPPPLVLNGWNFSTDDEKKERFLEHLNIANKNGKLGLIKNFLMKVKPVDFYYG